MKRVRDNNWTIRQLCQNLAGAGGFCLIGTAADIADVMEEWMEARACDGFNITPPLLPSGCADYVQLVTPELQRRGVFRREYEGRTLRENLGLKPHVNRYVRQRTELASAAE
jgi:alkanesulfonate monooxygenase